MLYVDIPTRPEMVKLAKFRNNGCVSIYLETSNLTQDTDQSRIALGNLSREAEQQLTALGFDKRDLAEIIGALDDLREDTEFWRFQARSLAIFVTSDSIRTYRLPTHLNSMVEVADRFYLKPLYRATAFPQSAFVLALSEQSVRLLEVHADQPAQLVPVEDLPKDAASALSRPSVNLSTHRRRLVGNEGENVLLEQFCRKVDAALRPVLAGREVPLILAATGRLGKLYPAVNSYPHLLEEGIVDSPDRMTEAEITTAVRPVLDAYHAKELTELRDLYARREEQGRATTDLSDAARAATFGAIDTLMVDIDAFTPGFIDDETGVISFTTDNDAQTYGIVDEIAARALINGGRIVGVRREDLPAQGDLAAILRFAV